MSFELGARQACDRRHRTMGTVHSGKISHLTWTFTKKYWAVLGCTGLYWAVLGHLRYLLGNVQVKWRILPLCNVGHKGGGHGLHRFLKCPVTYDFCISIPILCLLTMFSVLNVKLLVSALNQEMALVG